MRDKGGCPKASAFKQTHHVFLLSSISVHLFGKGLAAYGREGEGWEAVAAYR